MNSADSDRDDTPRNATVHGSGDPDDDLDEAYVSASSRDDGRATDQEDARSPPRAGTLFLAAIISLGLGGIAALLNAPDHIVDGFVVFGGGILTLGTLAKIGDWLLFEVIL